MEDLQALGLLASEYWKLLRAFEGSIDQLPESVRKRLQSQARYARNRLDSILKSKSMSIISFDGRDFEINLAVSAVNAEDFAGATDLTIERTLEPTVMVDMTVLITGKVVLARKSDDASRN